MLSWDIPAIVMTYPAHGLFGFICLAAILRALALGWRHIFFICFVKFDISGRNLIEILRNGLLAKGIR